MTRQSRRRAERRKRTTTPRPVQAEPAEQAAAPRVYEFRRIVERESGRTVAVARSYVPAVPGLLPLEESTCRSGIWEPTRRLARIGQGLDDYAVETVGASAVEEYLRDRRPPEHRYFAVVRDGPAESALHEPIDVLRVRTGQEQGPHERLGAGWEPYDMIDGVDGLRQLTLLEIDEDAVARFRRRGPVVRPKARRHYSYYEILPPNGGRPIAVVRHDDVGGSGEDAAVGWPVWDPSQWLRQIARGLVAYRARKAEPEAVERFLRQAAADLPEYRYFAFLDGDESIDSAGRMARMRCRADGEPFREETPLSDGTWMQTFSMLEINHGRGSWWLDPVEVPRWLFDRFRAERLTTR
jgi:hypothetical protein